jgi:hypothetical protein
MVDSMGIIDDIGDLFNGKLRKPWRVTGDKLMHLLQVVQSGLSLKLLEPLSAPLATFLLAHNLTPGDRCFGTIEFRLQIQLRHELLKIDLFWKMINNVQDFLFVHGLLLWKRHLLHVTASA